MQRRVNKKHTRKYQTTVKGAIKITENHQKNCQPRRKEKTNYKQKYQQNENKLTISLRTISFIFYLVNRRVVYNKEKKINKIQNKSTCKQLKIKISVLFM